MRRLWFLIFLAGSAFTFTGAAPVQAADSAVVLMYHRFGEDRYPSTSVRREQFEAQLEHLRDDGYAVIPLADLLAFLSGDLPALPERAVVITIDDAYRSVFEVAYPRFAEFGFPFTVFVATEPVDSGLADYMGWTEMREMAGSGATYANHGAGHVSLIARDASENEADWLARIRADVVKGRQRLSEELEPEPRVFAYPYGEYNLVAANLLAELGYRSFGQQSGAVDRSSDRRALPRFPINEAYGEMDQFRIKAASLPLPVTGILPWDPEVSTRMPTLEITLGASDARLAELACYVGGQGRVEVEWLQAKTRFRTAPANPLPDGRQRVNCTAPTAGGRYRWFSHSWFVRPR